MTDNPAPVERNFDELLSDIESGDLTPDQLKKIQAASKEKIKTAKVQAVEKAAEAHRQIIADFGEASWKAGYNVVRNYLHPRAPRKPRTPKTDAPVKTAGKAGNGRAASARA